MLGVSEQQKIRQPGGKKLRLSQLSRLFMETIQDLKKQLDGLVSSIENEDVENKELIAHKYVLVGIHAHTERFKLENKIQASIQKLTLKKQYRLYQSIESLLEKKAHELTAKEMFMKIKECQDLVNEYAT